MKSDFTDNKKTKFNILKSAHIQLELNNPAIFELVKVLSSSIHTSDSAIATTNALNAISADFTGLSSANLGIAAVCDSLSRNIDLIKPSPINTLRAIEITDRLSNILKNSIASLGSLAESQPDTNSDDYVIIDKSPARELEVPENIGIPLGRNRIRISTTLLVSIISLLVAIILSLSSSNLQQQKEQAQLLHDILESIDTSNSSLKEYFEDTRSVLENLNLDSQDNEEAPGSYPRSTDNTNELSNTESEN